MLKNSQRVTTNVTPVHEGRGDAMRGEYFCKALYTSKSDYGSYNSLD